MEAKETILLKDTPEMQVILNKDILEKNFSVRNGEYYEYEK